MFQHKFTTGCILQKSTAYKRNHLRYNKVIKVFKKKESVLKLVHHPYIYMK